MMSASAARSRTHHGRETDRLKKKMPREIHGAFVFIQDLVVRCLPAASALVSAAAAVAAASAATATAVAAASTTAAAIFLRFGFVNLELTAVKFFAVELCDGVLPVFF